LFSEFPLTWANYIDNGLASISGTAANWVIYSPTWSVTNVNPPLFEPVPGYDLLWPELKILDAHISGKNLQSVIFPILADEIELNDFWINENEIRVGGKPFMKGINDLSFKMLTCPNYRSQRFYSGGPRDAAIHEGWILI
jgi:hypothetical protein